MPHHMTGGRFVGRAELARARHPGRPSGDDGTAGALLERLNQVATGPAAAGIPELAAWQTLGRAEHTRLHGPPDPQAWAAAEDAHLNRPYHLAYAGFRHAEALLAAAGDRDTAAKALRRAAEITGPPRARRRRLRRPGRPRPGAAGRCRW